MSNLERAWMVRAGEGNELADQVEVKRAVAVAWAELGNLSVLTGLEQYREHYQAVYPEDPPERVEVNAEQLHNFVRRIDLGDYVLTYLESSEEILVGRIEGLYEYRGTLFSEKYPHVRRVQWLRRVPLAEFSEAVRGIVAHPLTVLSLEAHVEEIHRIVTAGETKEALPEDSPPRQDLEALSGEAPSRQEQEVLPGDAPAQQELLCGNCAIVIPQGAYFCPDCGAPVSMAVPAAAVPAAVPAEEIPPVVSADKAPVPPPAEAAVSVTPVVPPARPVTSAVPKAVPVVPPAPPPRPSTTVRWPWIVLLVGGSLLALLLLLVGCVGLLIAEEAVTDTDLTVGQWNWIVVLCCLVPGLLSVVAAVWGGVRVFRRSK